MGCELYKEANKLYEAVKLQSYSRADLSYYELLGVLKYNDTSMEQNVQCSRNLPGNVWLISYADGEVYIANQRALTHSGLNRCIDFYKHYSSKSIESAYSEAHKSVLTAKRGLAIGCGNLMLFLKR